MVNLGIAIMAHPKRSEFVDELSTQVDAPVRVTWDRKNNRWDTGRRAMLSYDKSCTHWLVLQDDAVVCRDLVAGLTKALEYVPVDSPVCLYVGGAFKSCVDSLQDDVTWLTMPMIHGGVGIVMPTQHIDEMIHACDPATEVKNYDERLGRWVMSQGLTVYYPWPSLVDHRSAQSLVPGRRSFDRQAINFLGSDVSSLNIDWSGKQVHIPNRPGWDPVRTTQRPRHVKNSKRIKRLRREEQALLQQEFGRYGKDS